jgi:hypothetical protein
LDIALPAIFGLLGVVVGVLLTGLLELWRQVLAFRAAARVIRYEIEDNVAKCIVSLERRRPDIALLDDAWKAHRLQIAPLMPRQVYRDIALTYTGLFIVAEWLRKVPIGFEEASREVKESVDCMVAHSRFLSSVERRSRIAQFLDALLARPTYPPRVSDKGIEWTPGEWASSDGSADAPGDAPGETSETPAG